MQGAAGGAAVASHIISDVDDEIELRDDFSRSGSLRSNGSFPRDKGRSPVPTKDTESVPHLGEDSGVDAGFSFAVPSLLPVSAAFGVSEAEEALYVSLPRDAYHRKIARHVQRKSLLHSVRPQHSDLHEAHLQVPREDPSMLLPSPASQTIACHSIGDATPMGSFLTGTGLDSAVHHDVLDPKTSPYHCVWSSMRTVRTTVYRLLTAFESDDITASNAMGAMSLVLSSITLLMVLLSVVSLCVETLPMYRSCSLLRSSCAGFQFIDWFTFAWLLLDFTLRCLCYPRGLHRFFLQFGTWVDALSFVPYILDASGATTSLHHLSVIRVMRLSRLLNLMTRSDRSEGDVGFIQVFNSALNAISLFFAIMLIALYVFSMPTYLLGQTMTTFNNTDNTFRFDDGVTEDNFDSAYATMWFHLVTFATVGYGDMIPVALLAKVWSGMCMVVGIVMFSFPTVIMCGSFHVAYHSHNLVKFRRQLMLLQIESIRMYRSAKILKLLTKHSSVGDGRKFPLLTKHFKAIYNRHRSCITEGLRAGFLKWETLGSLVHINSRTEDVADSIALEASFASRTFSGTADGSVMQENVSTSISGTFGIVSALTKRRKRSVSVSIMESQSFDVRPDRCTPLPAAMVLPASKTEPPSTVRDIIFETPKTFLPKVFGNFKVSLLPFDGQPSSPCSNSTALHEEHLRTEAAIVPYHRQTWQESKSSYSPQTVATRDTRMTLTHRRATMDEAISASHGSSGGGSRHSFADEEEHEIDLLAGSKRLEEILQKEIAVYDKSSDDDDEDTHPLKTPGGRLISETLEGQRQQQLSASYDIIDRNLRQLQRQIRRPDGVVRYPPKLKLLCVGNTNVISMKVSQIFPASYLVTLTVVLDDAEYHRVQQRIAMLSFGPDKVSSVELAPIEKLKVVMLFRNEALSPLPPDSEVELLSLCYLANSSFRRIQSSSVDVSVMCPSAATFFAFQRCVQLLKFRFHVRFSRLKHVEVQIPTDMKHLLMGGGDQGILDALELAHGTATSRLERSRASSTPASPNPVPPTETDVSCDAAGDSAPIRPSTVNPLLGRCIHDEVTARSNTHIIDVASSPSRNRQAGENDVVQYGSPNVDDTEVEDL